MRRSAFAAASSARAEIVSSVLVGARSATPVAKPASQLASLWRRLGVTMLLFCVLKGVVWLVIAWIALAQ